MESAPPRPPSAAPHPPSSFPPASSSLSSRLPAVSSPQRICIGEELLTLNGMPKCPAFIPLDALRRHLCILGTTGSGKSTCAAILCSELVGLRIPTVILDRTGEYADAPGRPRRGHCPEAGRQPGARALQEGRGCATIARGPDRGLALPARPLQPRELLSRPLPSADAHPARDPRGALPRHPRYPHHHGPHQQAAQVREPGLGPPRLAGEHRGHSSRGCGRWPSG